MKKKDLPGGRFLCLPSLPHNWQGALGKVERTIMDHPNLSLANNRIHLLFAGTECRVGREVIGPPVALGEGLEWRSWRRGVCRQSPLPDLDWEQIVKRKELIRANCPEIDGEFWRICLEDGEDTMCQQRIWLQLFEKGSKMFPDVANWGDKGQTVPFTRATHGGTDN